jgi:hypothetical protein
VSPAYNMSWESVYLIRGHYIYSPIPGCSIPSNHTSSKQFSGLLVSIIRVSCLGSKDPEHIKGARGNFPGFSHMVLTATPQDRYVYSSLTIEERDCRDKTVYVQGFSVPLPV